MRARFVTGVPRSRRGVAVGVGFLLAAGLATGITQAAGASPQPTVSQVEAKINALTSKFNKADEQYDQVATQLTAANVRLGQINKEMAADNTRFTAARKKVVQIAAASYMDSGQTSLAGLLTAGNPGQMLSEASIVAQITGSRNQQTRKFLSAARQLSSVQQEQQRIALGISQLKRQRAGTKNSIKHLLDEQKTELSNLTGEQQAQVGAGILGGPVAGAITSAIYTGPTGTQAEKAVAFAYSQLGCAYVFGSAGPCGSGYDCSGLVMSAYKSAGITIPRDTYEQWAALPHVASSDLQPGDLLYYNGIGHVAIYVGNGDIIDAPSAGRPVEMIPMSTPWYAENFDGVAVP